MPRFPPPADFASWSRRFRPSSFAANNDTKPTPTRHQFKRLIAFGLSMAVILSSVSSRAQSTATPQFSQATATAPLASIVAEASRRYGIPAAWIRAIIRAESAGDVHVTSPKGAMGLMQIVPDTWAELRRRYHLGDDPYDPHDNIMAGAAYLRDLRDRYGSPGFLAAYNAGPARWEDHLATGRPLPAETRAYLARLIPIVSGRTSVDAALSTSIALSPPVAPLSASEALNISGDRASGSRGRHRDQSKAGSAQDWTGLAPTSDGLFIAMPSERSPQ